MIKSTRSENTFSQSAQDQPKVEYQAEPAPLFRFGERFARNLALAGMLLLTVTAARNAKLPEGRTVLSAVQDMVEGNWDETLGKISFVSNMIPESVSVFFQSDLSDAFLSAPCFGTLTHGYSAAEPYLGYQCADGRVYSAAAGQVMSIAHGENEERILRIRHDNGLETLYYNLAETFVQEGDDVAADTCIAQAMADQTVIMEVKRDGLAIDPGTAVTERSHPAS